MFVKTRRVYFLRKSSFCIFKNSEIFSISSSLTRTYPGKPVQHFEHCRHLKRNPFLYQTILKLYLSDCIFFPLIVFEYVVNYFAAEIGDFQDIKRWIFL